MSLLTILTVSAIICASTVSSITVNDKKRSQTKKAYKSNQPTLTKPAEQVIIKKEPGVYEFPRHIPEAKSEAKSLTRQNYINDISLLRDGTPHGDGVYPAVTRSGTSFRGNAALTRQNLFGERSSVGQYDTPSNEGQYDPLSPADFEASF